MTEKQLENNIKNYLFTEGIYYFKVHGSKFMAPGISDLICCVNGKFLAIEVKRPGAKNQQTEVQKVHERNVIKAGGVYLLADNLQEVIEWVTKLKQS